MIQWLKKTFLKNRFCPLCDDEFEWTRCRFQVEGGRLFRIYGRDDYFINHYCEKCECGIILTGPDKGKWITLHHIGTKEEIIRLSKLRAFQ